jgi:hypothetical protein
MGVQYWSRINPVKLANYPPPPPLPLSGLLLGGTNALGRGNTFSTDLIAASFSFSADCVMS